MTPEQRQLFYQPLERYAWRGTIEYHMEWQHLQVLLQYLGTGMLIAWRVDVGPNTILTDAIEDTRNKVKLVGKTGHA